MFQYKFFKEPLRDDQVASVMDKITTTANLMEQSNISDLVSVLLPLFAYMAERRNDYKMNISNYLGTWLRHADFAEAIKTVFSNGTAD